MSICGETGLSRPECCCPACLEQQLRQFQPGLLSPADPEIRITRNVPAAERPSGESRPRG